MTWQAVRGILLVPFLCAAAWAWTISANITAATSNATHYIITYTVTICVERSDLAEMPEDPPNVTVTSTLIDDELFDDFVTAEPLGFNVDALVAALRADENLAIKCATYGPFTFAPSKVHMTGCCGSGPYDFQVTVDGDFNGDNETGSSNVVTLP